MKNYTSYPWAILFGLYFYLLFQVMFLLRFGSLNLTFNVLDLVIILVGIFSVALLFFCMRKLPAKQSWMILPFLLAVPLAYIGALGGGLLGAIGILIFGLVPFFVFLPIGYLIIKQSGKKFISSSDTST